MSECLDVILHCSSDLINDCKKLQEIFYYGDSQHKPRVDIVKIHKGGYLVQFELYKELLVLPAEESHIETDTVTPSRTLLASENEQLDIAVPSPTHTSNGEMNVENTEAVPAENEATSSSVAETNSVK